MSENMGKTEFAVLNRADIDQLLATKKDEETGLHLEKGGVLSDLTNFKVGQVNIGKPIAGLVVAAANDVLVGLIQRVTGGQLSVIAGRFSGAILNIVGLFLLNTKQVKGWLGSDAVEAGNIVLTADLITDYVFDIRGKISGMVGGINLGQTLRDTVTTDNKVETIDDYIKAHNL